METKIGRVKDYNMFYDSKRKLFTLQNDSGEEVAAGKSQEEVERQADALAKQKFTFPIKAIRYTGVKSVNLGRVTSLNISESSVWFSEDAEKGQYSYRGKERLRYNAKLFELTGHNAELLRQIREHQAAITVLEEQITTLAKGFEKPINLEYFGLTWSESV